MNTAPAPTHPLSVPLTRRGWLAGAATSGLGLPVWPGVSHALTPALAPAPAVQSALWRVASRLNYGPSLADAQLFATYSDVLDWANGQIDAAHAASQQPARIPANLPTLLLGIPELIQGLREQRQQQSAAANANASASANTPGTAAAGPAAPPAGPPAAVPPNAAEQPFIQRVVRQGAAWRLMAASNPALEPALLARMTEFWFNHFNVYVGKGNLRTLVNHYVLHAIRPHALSRFEDLLLATARHPAMLLYLDQAQSVADGTARGQRGLNENYARELMELHTLGVNGGYTQEDVRALARILTGWTVDGASASGFRFAPRTHDGGSKVLLGSAFAPAGEAEGIAALRMLARHPSTAQRIARRLAQWFVADDPPAALVERLAARFVQTGGDTRALLRTLLAAPEFWDEGNTLFKTPMDFACSALTVLGGVSLAGSGESAERDVQQSLGFLYTAGQAVHGWQTPDGYPVDKATWLNPEALTRRADLAMALAGRRDAIDLPHLRPHLSRDTLARIDAQAPRLRVGLMLSSPDFMRK